MRTDFKILEVKVPVIFSGTEGFPLRRDGRYTMDRIKLKLNSSYSASKYPMLRESLELKGSH